MSFEKENEFSLIANEVKKIRGNNENYSNNNFNNNNNNREIDGDDFIYLNNLQNLDGQLDLLKKKMSALEMWKTVNESTRKLCLGEMTMEFNIVLNDSKIKFNFSNFFILFIVANENTLFFEEISKELDDAEMKLKNDKIFEEVEI